MIVTVFPVSGPHLSQVDFRDPEAFLKALRKNPEHFCKVKAVVFGNRFSALKSNSIMGYQFSQDEERFTQIKGLLSQETKMILVSRFAEESEWTESVSLSFDELIPFRKYSPVDTLESES